MRLAYILYDGITLLDFIGAYDPLCRLRSQGYLPDFSWDTCALTPQVKDSFGLALSVDLVRPDLGEYDVILIPGGFGSRALQTDADFISWLQTAAPVPLKTSVCTGSLLLGAAGFLKEKRATTHFNEYGTLEAYCQRVVQERIVEDAGLITAGAVASSLDLGLYLCRKWAGAAAAERIKWSMGSINLPLRDGGGS